MRFENPLSALFIPTRREQYLAQYVTRECRRGRRLEAVLSDPYVVNRSTPDERGRLLQRPEVVEAIGEHRIEAMRAELTAAARTSTATGGRG